MKMHRFALMMLAAPIAFYAYACSSSDSGGNDNADAGNPSRDDSGSSGGEDSGGQDSGGQDSGGDGGDGGPTCEGNPLLAPGAATPDGGVNLDGGVARVIVPPAGFATFYDGPQWVDSAGGAFVVFSDAFAQKVYKLGPDGGTPADFRATANAQLITIGNAVKGGYVLTAVARQDPGQTAYGIYQTSIADGGAGPTLKTGGSDNPNDLVVLPNGTILFTDPQYQRGIGTTEGLYAIAPDGGVTTVQTADLYRPNGIALSPDGKALYVGQGPLPGDPAEAVRKILKYTVAADGKVSAPGTTFIDTALLTDVPDGIAVDVGGNLWVAEANATAATQSGRVEVFSPAGKKLGAIVFPKDRPTNVAFGGADGKGVYITTETQVYVYASRCAGLK